ncbi:MAG: DUF493 domain-containing protein [Deltaproteobacteria bacterium]|nr:DUF493 domain-containing protein [Deltaproteobacteria bacterium]
MPSEYEQESQRLSKLPRAERFDELVDFPTDFTFKAIGRGADFSQKVREVLDAKGYGDVVLMERPSKKGNFVSVTFSLEVHDGVAIDMMYTALEGLEDLAYLL